MAGVDGAARAITRGTIAIAAVEPAILQLEDGCYSR
jgi:hypothetical protein